MKIAGGNSRTRFAVVLFESSGSAPCSIGDDASRSYLPRKAFPSILHSKSERGACAAATSQEKKSKNTVHDSAEPEKIDRTAPAGPRKGRDVELHRAANPQLGSCLGATNEPPCDAIL